MTGTTIIWILFAQGVGTGVTMLDKYNTEKECLVVKKQLRADKLYANIKLACTAGREVKV